MLRRSLLLGIVSAALCLSLAACSDDGRGAGDAGSTSLGTYGSSGADTTGITDSSGSTDSGGGTSGGGTGTSGSTTGEPTTPTGGGECPPPSDGLASDIELTALELNQGVSVPLAQDGQPLSDTERLIAEIPTRLVAGRGGLLRAMYQTAAGWSARPIEAQLTLVQPDGTREVFSDERTISSPPDLANLDGTFNWVLAGEQIQAGTEYSVELLETGGGGGAPPANPPRIPDCGTEDMGVPDTSMVLKLVMIPVTMNGVTPNFSDENIQRITDGFFDMEPAREIEVRIREGITVDGGSIDSVVYEVARTRDMDYAARDEYYLGLAPQSEVGWIGVAVLGIGAAASPMSETVSHEEENTIDFAVHEVGHSLGLSHNPGCGPSDEQGWPYGASTDIQTQGYGLLSQRFYEAAEFHDYMNYCHPEWASAFTWENAADTIASHARRVGEEPGRILRGFVHPDGSTQWWVARGSLAERGDWFPATADLILADGSSVTVPAHQQAVPHSALKMVEAQLPVALDEIHAITVSAGGFSLPVRPREIPDFSHGLVRAETRQEQLER